MGEKRKSRQKDASTKRSKKGSKHASTETTQSSIPYPKPVNGSSFCECTTRLTVTLAPAHSNDHWAGIHETLNSMLLRFVPQIRGVVLSYSDVKMLSQTALLFNDSPYGQLEVSAKLLLWRPTSGMTLKGTINVQSPDHIGLLLWNTFNASIPASFIPKNKYEWRPFNEEELAAGKAEDESSETKDSESDSAKFGSGEWVLKGSSQGIGTNGSLEFIVSDVIRADNVLSVTGALH
ncbi:hypothetical protein LPJ55_001100 [Coemansia sp. RSA 990]|nr:hypothetical protein BX667DRAFT_467237 [Coemansia mojavensis]KAJ1752026.1 hypothetical protein LPJ79_001549 [Coemansia sp. RSA 1821]KAJ1874886.1 hypothetical protein LPJ55_001100 [Coemansia sp. RSA 990]